MTDDEPKDSRSDLVDISTVTLDAGGKNIIVLTFPDRESARRFEDVKNKFQETVDAFIQDDSVHVMYMTIIKGITLEVKKVQETNK